MHQAATNGVSTGLVRKWLQACWTPIQQCMDITYLDGTVCYFNSSAHLGILLAASKDSVSL